MRVLRTRWVLCDQQNVDRYTISVAPEEDEEDTYRSGWEWSGPCQHRIRELGPAYLHHDCIEADREACPWQPEAQTRI